ncbi:MAG: DUF2249 domain-containing protein [Saprospiraceae bacterium]|nr:DUF2249 domain-containing protein [Saprospiraceae bacterium]
MLINEKTKIAALLKHHPDALETIVAIAPDFKKLRNPILRKLMAGRTSIAMASKVGGCKPEDFFNALAPLGFEVDHSEIVEDEPVGNEPYPEYLKALSTDQMVEFDVRGILASGQDPLKAIQQKVKELKPGHALVIINNFEPVPLIKLLEKQGFLSYVKHVDPERIETYFFKTSPESEEKRNPQLVAEAATSGDWDTIKENFAGRMIDIDVRHLEMPMPMMTILEALDSLPADHALYVYHKRIPVFLLTELKDRSFDYRIKDVQPGEVYLMIFKEK